MKTINEIVLNTIEKYFTQFSKNAPFDKTVQGKIIAVNTDGTYNVMVNGNVLNNVPFTLNNTLSIYDSVWVTYPSNNVNNVFINRKK
jgi:hypothetical protein